MKIFFVCYVVSVIIFSKGTLACFTEDFVNNRSVTTGSPFYEECCCTESGHVLKDLYWLNPYNMLVEPQGPGMDLNVYTEELNNCLSLHIPSVSKTLSGAYRCITNVKGIKHTQTHNLDVYDQLYFFSTPVNQYLVFSNDSLITCEANGATPPYIRWYRDKEGQVEITNNTAKYFVMPQGLLVRNVNNDDDGIYKCQASVLSTGEEVEVDITVKVMTPPIITSLTASPENIVVAKDGLSINCTAEGLPYPKFEWKKISESLGNHSSVSFSQGNDTIIFKSVKPEDAGTYECIVRNFVGESKKQINIQVYTPPEIIGFKNITALEGTEIAFYCNATGIPAPNVTITYEGKSLDEERETEYEVLIPNFSLLAVNRSKEGFYICNASNEVDTKSVIMYLSVAHKPYFDEPFEDLWGWSGETVNISCEHESNPPANITWRFQKGNFSTIEKQEYDNIVLDYATALEHSFPFTDQFAPFGIHECRVQNIYGEAFKTYLIRKGFPPSYVENATTIDESATSATFSIETPKSFEGPQVIGFIAEYDEENNYKITNIHPNRTWAVGVPFKLEKLKPNTTYYIRIAAINRVGTGEWSDMMEFATMDKSAPEPPIWQVDALQVAATKLLKWKAPENNGEPIDYYALRYCLMDEDEDEKLEESLCKQHRLEAVNELEIADLQHNTTYYFELIAHNSEGNSTPANISLTIPATIKGEPEPLLSGGALIGISVIVVILALILLDIFLFFWRKQGIIASCCYKKTKKRKPNPLNSRDKKGLLKDNGESGTEDTLRRPNNGHKEFEYNKTTGIITGKHSSV